MEDISDEVTGANAVNRFVSMNAENGISPCTIAILAENTDREDTMDAEIVAILFVECWKGGFDGVEAEDVAKLRDHIKESHSGFLMLCYPTAYAVME